MTKAAKIGIHRQLGQAIRQLRLAMGLTPKEFADDIGKERSFLLALEEGAVEVDLTTIERCASTLGLEISGLFDAAHHCHHLMCRCYDEGKPHVSHRSFERQRFN